MITENMSQNWERTDSNVYKITKNITIGVNETLIIESGDVLLFGENVHILCMEGKIIAKGTENKPIVFDAVDKKKGWGGIFLDNSSKSRFFNCRFLNIKEPKVGSKFGGVSLIRSYAHFKNSIFENIKMSNGALYIYGGSAKIENCIFNSNSSGGAIRLSSAYRTIFKNCEIKNNKAAYGGGVSISDESFGDFTNCNITNNRAKYEGGGIYCEGMSSIKLLNCNVLENKPDNIKFNQAHIVSLNGSNY